jgi:tetratricopeptide (TPR) repeat protein
VTEESKSIKASAGNESNGSQAVQTRRRTIKYDNRTYAWTGKRWVDIQTFTSPPAMIVDQLDALLLPILLEEDEKTSDVKQLIDRAKDAKKQAQYSRAEGLARKALQLSPDYPGAVAVLCSCLRSLNRPEEALKASELHKMVEYPPVILTRAAALCDLGRWEDAMIEVRKVLAISKKHSSWGYSNIQADRIINRIKAIRPDLF